MGIPKFYRWISERFPCINQIVKENQIPEFHNLYIDMNSIIHECAHPENQSTRIRNFDEICEDIGEWVEALLMIIKPKKILYLAVDGVAPRSKMNQQRGRRFKAARDVCNPMKQFDSCCISPGTEFMAQVDEFLKYFLVNKITTDKQWQEITVLYSGHLTPGEGEHKIMEYLRFLRTQPEYDPGTRHCLFGSDADLIVLGLAAHEPQFSIMWEEIKFGNKNAKKRPLKPAEKRFRLVHLSLLREYLAFEFQAVKENLTPAEFDFRRVLDDIVLLSFFVGNDFLPHVPELNVFQDAMPLIWKTYCDIRPSLGGYMTADGHVNLDILRKFLHELSQRLNGDDEVCGDEDERLHVVQYIKALEWVFRYYNLGVPSWRWFFPYHYAPHLAHLRNFCSEPIAFELDIPFQPFEVLLAILPPASASLLPEAYQPLVHADSVIGDFYPNEFQCDLNGKKEEWQAIALIPFVDEERLLKAMQHCEQQPTAEEELRRNVCMPMVILRYTKEGQGEYGAPNIGHITDHHAKWTSKFDFAVDSKSLIVTRSHRVKLDDVPLDCPTFHRLPYEMTVKNDGVQVFQAISKMDSIIVSLTVDTDQTLIDLPNIFVDGIMGKSVFVNYPYMHEGRVVGLSTRMVRCDLVSDAAGVNIVRKVLTPDEQQKWHNDAVKLREQFRKRRGMLIDSIIVIVHARFLMNKRRWRDADGQTNQMKFWERGAWSFPYQTVVFTADEDSSLHDATRDKPSQHEVVAGEAGCSSRTQAHQAMVHQHQPGSVSSASHQHQPSLSADEHVAENGDRADIMRAVKQDAEGAEGQH